MEHGAAHHRGNGHAHAHPHPHARPSQSPPPGRGRHGAGAGAGAVRTHSRLMLLVVGVCLAALCGHLLLLGPLARHRDAHVAAVHAAERMGMVTASGGPLRHGAGGVPVGGNMLMAFDADSDGVLDVTEFEAFVREACKADDRELGLWQRVRRWASLSHLLASPCTKAMLYRRRHMGHGAAADAAAAAAAAADQGVGGGDAAAAAAAVTMAAAAAAVEMEYDEAGANDPAVVAAREQLDSGCLPLGRPLLEAVARKGTVLLVASDWAMWQLLGVNWVSHVKEAGIRNWLAAAWKRVEATQRLLALGFGVLGSDIDTVWLRNPGPYFDTTGAGADLLVASDLPTTGSQPGDVGLEAAPLVGRQRAPSPSTEGAPTLHTGVVLARATRGGRAALQLWAAARQGRDTPAAALVRWLAKEARPAAAAGQDPGGALPEAQRLLRVGGWKSAIHVGVLSSAVVLNGYTHAVNSLAAAQQLPPGSALALHASWSGASLAAKMLRLREAALYADGGRYYTDPPLMSFTLHLPGAPAGFNTWADGGAMLTWHLQAMRKQMSQLYWAAALAALTGRALIMPRMQCYCFNGNGGPTELCRAPGDRVAGLPFNCTLDQVFVPDLLYQHLPVVQGRPLQFREPGFLSNPRLPGWIRYSATEVTFGAPECDAGAGGGAPNASACVAPLPHPRRGVNQQLLVSSGLTEAALLELMQPYAAAKWVHFTDLRQPGLVTWSDPARQASFEAWLDRVSAPWCCGEGGEAAAAAAAAAAAGGGGEAVATGGEGGLRVMVRPPRRRHRHRR